MGKRRFTSISWEKIGVMILFILSFYLMFHTFSYDSQKHEMLMASRVWSDFGAHIPLIRSFSFGSNIPPQYPIFPGEKIHYHFLLYMIAGLLEKFGLRIDYALNIPSALGFFFLTVMIYKTSIVFFNKKSVGVLSVLFFLFNGSFSFLKFFEKHPFGASTLHDIITNNQFSTFGPWDGNLVTAFVHLNIYTNQRHIALSFAMVLFVLTVFVSYSLKEKIATKGTTLKERLKQLIPRAFPYHSWNVPVGIGFGLVLSSLLFLNQAALLIAVIFIAFIFLSRPTARIPLILSFLISLPFLYYFFTIATLSGTPTFEPGYLSHKPFEWTTFFEFWIHNLGLHIVFIPLGILLAPKKIRFFFIPLLILFALPNVYRFSPDMINNHKFLNFFTILGGMYSAHALETIRVFVTRKIHVLKKKIVVLSFTYYVIRILFSSLLATSYFLLTFSGILDFMPIVNDYTIVLSDIPTNKDALFILNNTPPDAVVLNSTWFYHPASIAGRKVYNGYSFFTWSAGYDTYGRESLVKEMYRTEDKGTLCKILQNEHISYVELNRNPENFLKPISNLWNFASPMYENTDTGVRLYDVSTVCSQL